MPPQHQEVTSKLVKGDSSNNHGSSSNYGSSSTDFTLQEKFLDSILETQPIVMISKQYSPFCVKAKKLFAKYAAEFPVTVYEVDQELPEFFAATGFREYTLYDYISQQCGQSEVPIIFVNNEFIGGCAELEGEWETGRIPKLLERYKAKKLAQSEVTDAAPAETSQTA